MDALWWVILAPLLWIVGVVTVAAIAVWRKEKRLMKNPTYRIEKAYEADQERQHEDGF